MNTRLTGKRTLVTGANGFIGAHLCRRLQKLGAEVHAVYRSAQGNSQDALAWWQADLANVQSVRRIIADTQPEIIYHLASHVKGAPGIEHVLPTFQSNLQSTVNILTVAAETTRPRVVLTGSLAEPDLEAGEMFPSAPYAAAKWACSGYARMFQALYKLPVAIARVFMVYGPAQIDLTKLIPYVTLSLLQGKAPEITSGKRLVDWIYVSDVVNGLIELGLSGNVDGTTVDLGSGSLVSIREIVEQVADVVGNGVAPIFGALPDRPMEPTRIARIADSFAAIGWKPEVSLRQGLERTVDWYRRNYEVSPEPYQAVPA